MSTSSTPPDEGKARDGANPADEGKLQDDAVDPSNEEKSVDSVNPADEEKSADSAVPPNEEKLSNTVDPADEEKSADSTVTPNEGKPADTGKQINELKPRDAAYWAQQAATLRVSHVPTGALNLNVEGKRVVGPLQGFGQMWQKTYRVFLHGASVQPIEVIKTWKERFRNFWPKGNRFYAPLTGIAPGEVALINASLGAGMELSTGVLVLYADEESFTLMTPQGHVFAGWITFSAYEEDDCIIAQVQLLIRANDPLYEAGLRLFAHKAEDRLWQKTLESLATHFEVAEAKVETNVVCLDPRLQWSQAGNIWHNAGIRTMMYKMSAPLRWIRGRARS